MSTILVTPKGEKVLGSNNSCICFPALERWETVGANMARACGARRIAPPDFEQRIEMFQRGEEVDLAKGGQLRLGVGVIPIIGEGKGRKLAFRQFGVNHPTRPNQLTPPAGLFEGRDTPWKEAWNELFKELIPVGYGEVGRWDYGGLDPLAARGRKFALEHNVLPNGMKIPVIPLQPPEGAKMVSFGKYPVYKCLIEFEPDTSSVELLFPVRINLPRDWEIVDGEQLPDGSWCDQPIWLIPAMTTKAKIAIANFG